MRARLIVNPIAGQRRAQRNALKVEKALRQRGIGVTDTVWTRGSGDARQAAEDACQRGYDQVIVGAGDGTLNEVINALAGSEVVLGVVPLGTGNVFACNTGVPLTVEGACEVLVTGEVREVDLGLCNGRHFLLMAGVGFDGQVVRRVRPKLKTVLRGMAYILTTLNTLATYRSSRVTLTLDDQPPFEREVWLVMVGNVASYAWEIKVTSQARIDDGWLDLCVFPEAGKLGSFRQTLQTLTGRHVECREVEYYRTRRLRLESDPPVPVQLDGDVGGMTPLDISVVPKALRVVLPRDLPPPAEDEELLP